MIGINVAVIFDEPDFWKLLGVWDLSIKMRGGQTAGSEEHAQQLNNLTGLGATVCRERARVLLNSQLAFPNGEIDDDARQYIERKLSLEIDPEAKRGAMG